MTPLEHALACAARGWAVYPVGTDKIPRTPRGHKSATTDPDQIRGMAVQFGFVLVGIATGDASNVAVLDIDRQHNGLEWWAANRNRLPATRTHRTRSGGLHLFFKHQPGLRCSTAKIAPGIDVRAEGGSIIYWPAIGLPVLCDAPPEDWPDWLTPTPKPAPPPAWKPIHAVNADVQRRYAEAALHNAVRRVAGTAAGSRNANLNAETYGLARFIQNGALSPAEIAKAMAHAGIAAGLDAREVQATIASAMGGAAQ
ncbi:bifunctional DNA primase/polymerase [Acidocella aminolytica]|uniref:DNA recombinase RecA n=1 Tax=Acidocella aminolytica 101 = DSM 11237 TaxID=1120923 RepID=A0A0D6PB77_9PROT|nr:bifunctional DNA primase/polymerase [Acidocella aminolytica]GAN79025.1 DNA recombinase RecA [Acidocella aminolytica 101 = DSM 11237]GBQ38453.1 DNA recombinase [Acidocella aminolytica 101 = DSM 11237]SHF37892.1 Bifunctional DNA primase/polymerase, N-terminal [Acidocella aminolytica 101 = DSM 11237]